MPPVSSPGLALPPRAPVRRLRADAALSRVRFRRAVTLLLMTLVLPGSAQLVAGRREVGRIALRVWLRVVGAFVGDRAASAWSWHGFVFWLASNTVVLGFVRLLLCALAVGWALLFIDAWRLGQPLELLQKQRLAMVGLNGVLCFSVAGSLLFASHVVAVQKGFISAMFGDGAATRRDPRPLQRPAARRRLRRGPLGPAAGQPHGGQHRRGHRQGDPVRAAAQHDRTSRSPRARSWTSSSPTATTATTCELEQPLDLGPGQQGAVQRATTTPASRPPIEGVEGITGLKINYYAMVNLQGFRSMVQAVGGLKLNVRDRIPIGGVGGPVTGYIEPGVQRLNGFETLWFARSRESADDYSRMARQKCVMNAMLQQLVPADRGARSSRRSPRPARQLITTDLPASRARHVRGARDEGPLASRSRTVSFVPPVINTGHPDIAKIHADGEEGDRPLRGQQGPAKTAAPAAKASHGQEGLLARRSSRTVGGSIGNLHDGYAANAADRPVERLLRPAAPHAARSVGCRRGVGRPVSARVVAVVVTWNRRELLVESLPRCARRPTRRRRSWSSTTRRTDGTDRAARAARRRTSTSCT